MATNCCACGKPLVDAKSVETGMGPVCRKKYGYGVEVSEDARVRANAIIYQLALAVSTGAVTLETLKLTVELTALGFPLIADIFNYNCAPVTVEVREHDEDLRYFVRTPYDPAFNSSSWMKGRYGVKIEAVSTSKKKVFHWVFPHTEEARTKIFNALVKHFGGTLARGPLGPFTVKPLKTAAQKAAEAAQNGKAA
jgi:hypothetical protein